MNHTEHIKDRIKPNVYLGRPEDAKNMPTHCLDKKGQVRGFFALRDIKQGEQIVWDYVYHEKMSKYIDDKELLDDCSCGLPAADCFHLKCIKDKIDMDTMVEKIIDQVSTLNGKRYLVKYEGHDPVCNAFVDEFGLVKLEIFKDFRKDLRKKKAQVEYRIYGCDESAGVDNADDSSGDDDEDKRAAARVSAPRNVYHLDREYVINKGIIDVAYVFYRFVLFC